MPICISCSHPVPVLYTTYSRADDRALGKGVRLTQCQHCKKFADKYVEHDFVVLFIDLVLIKPQVYRHLLFNRLSTSTSTHPSRLDPSIIRLGTLLVLFDVYITWARIERTNSSFSPALDTTQPPLAPLWALVDAPIITQYLFFLTMNILATVAQHALIRFLAGLWLRFSHPNPTNTANQGTPSSTSEPGGKSMKVSTPGQASPSAISTALLVSSCTKLFPILLVIWPSSSSSSSSPPSHNSQSTTSSLTSHFSNYVSYAVLLNNIEALLILLNCGYVVATALAVAGFVGRWWVEGFLLGCVGLSGGGMEEGAVAGAGGLGKLGWVGGLWSGG